MTRQGASPHGIVALDDLDRCIMRCLRRSGRMPYSQVAREIGSTEPTVRKRVNRLISSGAIFLVARLNPAAIGFPLNALIGVRVSPGRVPEVGARLSEMEHVAYVAYITGSFDILIEAFLPDAESLFRFINADLETVAGIVYMETWHALHTEKLMYMWEGENVGRAPLAGEVSSGTQPSVPTPEAGRLTRAGAGAHGTVALDDLDWRIMRCLRRDGRMPYSQVADGIGSSESTVRKRVNRLVGAGAVDIVARVNPAAIGFAVDAVIGVRVSPGRVPEVGARLSEMEHVADIAYITGSFDILIEAFLPDAEGLFKFINADLETIAGIVSTETWHVLRTEKFNYMWEGGNLSRAPLTGDG